MSNFAALIDVLSISGSRLSDGSPNASGKVWFFEPGGNTPVNVYSDAEASAIVTAPVTLTDGGLVSRSDYPDGIFATQPIRLYIEDVDGNVASDLVWIPATAGDVGVNNAGWTATNLDDVLTALTTSTGGDDGKFLESAGATERTIAAKLAEGGISVKDFGAVGDGVAIDTTAIQAAFSRAKVLSCNVIFPAGTYKTDQAITLTSATGVNVVGAGRGAVLIKPTHATANAFTLTTCTDCGVHGLSILHTTGSTGAGIAASASPRLKLTDLYMPANGTFVGFAYAIDLSGASDFDHIEFCEINADIVALRSNTTSSAKPQVLIGNQIGASSAAPVSPTSGIEFNGGNGNVYAFGNRITGATNNVLFNASLTGGTFRFFGNSIAAVLGSAPFNLTGLATDPDLRQQGNGVDGYTVNVTSGSTVTPDRSQGPHIRIRGTTTGSAYVVAAPTPTPTGLRDTYLRLTFYANAGGAITGWTMNAVYHLSAGPSTTDGQLTSYVLLWDADASVWREFSRAVTT